MDITYELMSYFTLKLLLLFYIFIIYNLSNKQE